MSSLTVFDRNGNEVGNYEIDPAEFAPRIAAIRDQLPGLEVLIQVADESGNELLPGAVDYEEALASASDDKPAEFSSRGPTPDGVTKPDIVAPGVTIMAGRTHQSESAQMAGRMDSTQWIGVMVAAVFVGYFILRGYGSQL